MYLQPATDGSLAYASRNRRKARVTGSNDTGLQTSQHRRGLAGWFCKPWALPKPALPWADPVTLRGIGMAGKKQTVWTALAAARWPQFTVEGDGRFAVLDLSTGAVML